MITIHILFQIEVDIMMRDQQGTFSSEIDNFNIAIPFPSGHQEDVFTGNRGIANITLSYDIICLESHSCSTPLPPFKLKGTSEENPVISSKLK